MPVHSRNELFHGGIDTIIEFDGDRPQGCLWDRSVCTDPPTHQVTYASREEPEVYTFCARHYTLELAYLVEVHMPSCTNPLSEHVTSYGRID